MPRIRTEEAPQGLGLQPTEIGVESTAAAARRGGAFFNQAAQDLTTAGHEIGSAIDVAGQAALNVVAHREISHGAETFSEVNAKLVDAWNATAKNADPNDPSVAAKFRDEVLTPSLDQFRGNFITERGQNWAESHVDAFRQHMVQKTDADMSTLAGEAVKTNFAKTINNLSATARLDPSSLDFALASAGSALEGVVSTSPTLSATDAGRVRTEGMQKARESIVKSAVVGMIEKNPNIDLTAIEKKYGDYITGPEMQLFQKATKAQAKADFLTNKQIELYQRQQDENQAHAAANKNFTDNVEIDPATNRVTVKPGFFKGALDIAKNNPNAPNAATIARTYIDWAEGQQRQRAEPVVSDPATKAGLIAGLGDPKAPTDELKVLRAAADDKLSTRDTTLLREMVHTMGPDLQKDPVVHASIAAASERVGVGLVGDGHERFAGFMQTFLPQYLAQKRAGTLPPNALDLKDPNSLISQSLKQYEPPAADRMMMHQLKMLGVTNIDQVTKGDAKSATVTLPPIKTREKDKTYPTARGPMTWTGTGWVSPEGQKIIGAMDDGFRQLEAIARSIKINPEGWKDFIENAPKSVNVEDRRGEPGVGGGRRGFLKLIENNLWRDLLR